MIANDSFYFEISLLHSRMIHSDLTTFEVPLIVIHPFQPRFSNLLEPLSTMTNMYLWIRITCYFESACWKTLITLKELLFILVRRPRLCSIMGDQDTNEGEHKYSVANFWYEKVRVGNPVKLRFTNFLKLESFHEAALFFMLSNY